MDKNVKIQSVQEVPQTQTVEPSLLEQGFNAWKNRMQNKMLGVNQATWGNRQGNRAATKKYADGRQKDQKWRKANHLNHG